MIYEYECWKCPEWHQTDGLSAARFARVRITIGRARITLPRLSAFYDYKWWRMNDAKALFAEYFTRCDECNRITSRKKIIATHHREYFCERCY